MGKDLPWTIIANLLLFTEKLEGLQEAIRGIEGEIVNAGSGEGV